VDFLGAEWGRQGVFCRVSGGIATVTSADKLGLRVQSSAYSNKSKKKLEGKLVRNHSGVHEVKLNRAILVGQRKLRGEGGNCERKGKPERLDPQKEDEQTGEGSSQ